MTIRLSSKGQGGVFVPYGPLNSLTVSSGSSGELINITPSPNNIIRVLALSTDATSQENNITVTITNNSGDVDIITNSTLNDSTPAVNGFYIGSYPQNIGIRAQGMELIDCQGFVVTKTTGNTTNDIIYSYIEGRIE